MDIMKDRILFLIDGSGKNDKFLEEAIKLPRGIIYKWRHGKNKNFKFYLTEIASYFHVSADYLLGSTDDPSPTGQKEKLTAQKDGEPIDWDAVLEGLSQDELKEVMEIAMKKFMEGKQK